MSRITDIHLERYLAGILSPSETKRIEALIKSDSELSLRIESLRRSNEDFFAEATPDVFARRLQGRLEMQQPSKRSWMDGLQRLSLTFAMLFVCGAVYWFTESAGPMETTSLSQNVKSSIPVELVAPAPQDPDSGEPVTVAEDHLPLAKPTMQEAVSSRRRKTPVQSPPAIAPKGALKRQAATPQRKSAQELKPNRQNKAKSNNPEVASRPSARRAPPSAAPRMFMRKFAPKPVQIRVKGPGGELRVPGKPIELVAGDALVISAVPGSQFYWSYALVGKSGNGPDLRPSEPKLYDGSAAHLDIRNANGPTDVWVFYSPQPFSTEKILFEGVSYRSQDEKIQILRFSAIF